ncbi:zinc ABC transporter substrate-binding protein AztC [Terrihabitans sp. B22-R8]|uniref:zinc ABC transporter substrate-binding protein AztC n=1 Tax=Terrihabitans sp. B22-R8 TaxID=3425128 RepID=UPI00403CCA4E
MSRSFSLATALTVITFIPVSLPASAAEPVKVVASFSIIGDLAKNVGGDRIALTTLVGPNGDAHVYEPRPADAAAIRSADVVLVNGLGFEGFLPRLVEASGTKAPLVEVSKGAKALKSGEDEHHHHDHAGEEGHRHSGDAHAHDEKHAHDDKHDGHDHAHEKEHGHHHHGDQDPHAWQSVPNVKIYVANIAEALCSADAAGCDAYKANAQAYNGKLDALDTEIRAGIAAIPEGKRTIITSHDAFGYFQSEYGLKFLAPEGVSTEAEASAADVAALIRQVREDKASAIFVENITNPRLIEQIAKETGAKAGGTLYSDALTDASGPASTYVDMMRANVTTIGAALGK